MTGTDFDWQGRHRIYLSVAPGAGAAHRMLADAQALAAQGHRVAIGFTDLGRLEPFAEGLPMLPMRRQQEEGSTIEVIDLETVRRNPPALVLIGNLAHYYGSGARYAYRIDEIQELQRLGCAIGSNLYAYEIEPLIPIYRRLTHLDPPTAVPSSVLDQAEVIFIDADPQDMIRRLEAGELMPTNRTALARRTLYRSEVLAALRRATISLLELRGPQQHLRSTERLMVCVGYNPNSAYLIQRARQIADGLGADLLAVHVRPPAGGSTGYEVALQQNLALAEDLGAQTMVPRGRDVAAILLHVAKTYRVTAIAIGRPEIHRWGELIRSSLLTQILNADRAIDIYVIPEPPPEVL